jgi:hypothetical protein
VVVYVGVWVVVCRVLVVEMFGLVGGLGRRHSFRKLFVRLMLYLQLMTVFRAPVIQH